MHRLRILPGAAGLIALTATMGFADTQRGVEGENFSRGRITLVRGMTRTSADGASSGRRIGSKASNPIYRVEITRGEKVAEVMVDGATGRILQP